jgi:D-alanyl-D-alanine dipeptidase
MQIVEIDLLHSESLQRSIAGPARVLWGSIDAPILHRGVHNDTELRGQDHIVSPAEQRLSYLDLGVTIDVRRVEKIHAQVERTMDKFDCFDIVLHTAGVHIGDTDAHATKSNRRYLRTAMTDSSLFHWQ